MKRFLLTLGLGCATVLPALSQSQTYHLKDILKINRSALQLKGSAEAKAQPKRTLDNGVYYKRPSGSMYYASTRDGEILGEVNLGITPFTTVVFKPIIPEDASGYKWMQYQYFFNTLYGSYDRTEDENYVDSDGNFYFNMFTGLREPAPTLEVGGNSYTIGENNIYWHGDVEGAALDYFSRVYCCRPDGYPAEIIPQSFSDEHSGDTYFYGLVGSDDYIWGTGSVDVDGESYTATGVSQVFEAPMSPLYVEDIFLACISSDVPLSNNATLTLNITGVITDDAGTKESDGNVIATLTATAEDAKFILDVPASGDKASMMKYYTLTFKPEAPFTLTDEFAVVVDGLDKDGVDVGFVGIANPAEDALLPASLIAKSASGDNISRNIYEEDITLNVTFSSMFDRVLIDNTDDRNVLKISDDGNTCVAVGTSISGKEVTGASFYCAMRMEKDQTTWNYEFEGLPDWIESYYYDLTDNNFNYNKVIYLGFKAKPLPDELKEVGRSAYVYVKGNGVRSEHPIVILQGNAEYTGIDSAVADESDDTNAPIYNLQGVRVTKDYKGIVIQNGKKRIQ